MSRYIRSIKYFLKSLAIKESLGDKRGSSRTMNNIASIFYANGNLGKALIYFQRNLVLQTELKDSNGVAFTYSNMGLIFSDEGHYQKALDAFKRNLAYCEKTDNVAGQGVALGNIGLVYYQQQQFGKALDYFIRALKYKRETGDMQEIAITLNHLGSTYLKRGNLPLSMQYASECLDISLELGSKKEIYECYELLSSIYEKEGLYKESLEYHQKFTQMKDSVFNEEKHLQITEMQEKYEADKKEKEISLLSSDREVKELQINRQRSMLLFIGLFFFLTASVAILLFSRYRLRQKHSRLELERKNLEVEQRLLRAQMNPHFIFNSLSSIQAFIVEHDTVSAVSYLAKFANLMRYILENSRKTFIPLEDELNALQINLELERLRFKEKFDFAIEVEETLEQEIIGIPPMVVQPFVENAILHGLCAKEGKGHLRIAFRMNSNHMICEIRDDGIGRMASESLKADSGTKHVSLGMQLIRERFELLEKESVEKCSYTVLDLEDQNGKAIGTVVSLQLPVKNI